MSAAVSGSRAVLYVYGAKWCRFCLKAKAMLAKARARGWRTKYVDIGSRKDAADATVREQPDHRAQLLRITTIPAVFVGAKYLGGSEELAEFLQSQSKNSGKNSSKNSKRFRTSRTSRTSRANRTPRTSRTPRTPRTSGTRAGPSARARRAYVRQRASLRSARPQHAEKSQMLTDRKASPCSCPSSCACRNLSSAASSPEQRAAACAASQKMRTEACAVPPRMLAAIMSLGPSLRAAYSLRVQTPRMLVGTM